MSTRTAAAPNRYSITLERFRTRLGQALRGMELPAGRLLTVTLSAPELRSRRFPRLPGDWFYWSRPEQGRSLLGYGEAQRLQTAGEGRLNRLAGAFRRVRPRWLHIDPDHTHRPAIAFTAFAFSGDDPMTGEWHPFPNTLLLFPELLLEQEGGRAHLSFSARIRYGEQAAHLIGRWMRRLQTVSEALSEAPPEPPAHTPLQRTGVVPADSDWLRQVTHAVAGIHQGRMTKVVPSRRVRICTRHPVAPARLVNRLLQLNPTAAIVSVGLGDRHFVAATPERLATVSGHRILCDAIGGTGQRSADPALDREQARRLLHSPKTRHEHALVVNGIRRVLAPLCCRLDPSPEPALLPLRNLRHLWTPIRGRLNPGRGVLDAAALLHPTAATSGHPATVASAWLTRQEQDHRGWYAGAAGWVDRDGNGELSVLLRCALVQGCEALLYAGAGVTGDSSPTAELRETELKLRTILEALESA